MKNIFKIKNKNVEKNSGVAVLFAVLVAVLMVSVAATMVSIAIRQTILSNTGRDSQYAMFAANTALECALYWDLKSWNSPQTDFGTSTDKVFPNLNFFETRDSDIEDKGINCNNQNIVKGDSFDPHKQWLENGNNTTFYIKLTPTGSSAEYCASATVKKSKSGTEAVTVIEARGYNTCDLASPRAIERGLELSYTS